MKKKLRLNVEELKVEAFATADVEAKLGTVHGHDDAVTDGPTCACPTAGDQCTRDGGSCSGANPCFCPESRDTYCC